MNPANDNGSRLVSLAPRAYRRGRNRPGPGIRCAHGKYDPRPSVGWVRQGCTPAQSNNNPDRHMRFRASALGCDRHSAPCMHGATHHWGSWQAVVWGILVYPRISDDCEELASRACRPIQSILEALAYRAHAPKASTTAKVLQDDRRAQRKHLMDAPAGPAELCLVSNSDGLSPSDQTRGHAAGFKTSRRPLRWVRKTPTLPNHRHIRGECGVATVTPAALQSPACSP